MPYLPDQAARLNQLNEANLSTVIADRLYRRPRFVNDDPGDFFIKLHERNVGGLPLLGAATAGLIDSWQAQPIEQLIRNPEPMGEALYMVSRVGASEGVAPVAKVAGNEQMSQAVLTTREDLQGRALRSLAGLLVEASVEDQWRYRHLFEAALDRVSHAPIGLMTMAGFWPSERDAVIERVLAHGDPQLTRLTRLVDVITPMFKASNA